MVLLRKMFVLALLCCCCNFFAQGQRAYKTGSILASGQWYKISVNETGIYQLNTNVLSALGITGSIPSGQIRLFGSRKAVVPEKNSEPYYDELEELAIQVMDGGDGVFNGPDQVLFYAEGPQRWRYDSGATLFTYRENIYTDQTFYYLTTGGAGKRIPEDKNQPAGGPILTSFDERWHHELDSVNFLASGKEWFGEEFASLPGRTLSRTFHLPVPDAQPGLVTLISDVVARSAGNSARFDVLLNGGAAQQIAIPAVGTGRYDVFARQAQQSSQVGFTGTGISLTYGFVPGSFNAQGWLNWFELFFRRKLFIPASGQLAFRDKATLNGAVIFEVSGAEPSTRVWEVTDPLNPVQMAGILTQDRFRFGTEGGELREYVALSGNFPVPRTIGRVANQNLHGAAPADYFIIAPAPFLSQAKRLAAFHQKQKNLRTVVVTTDQVYNEFSAGIPDPSAIRNFIKMYFDRFAVSWHTAPKYLLLFGKGSYDYRGRSGTAIQWVVPFESSNTLDPLGTYTSDDFFGFLDDHEDINDPAVMNLLDIGIGRVPAANVEEAKAFVDKVEAYHGPSALGPWRNRMNFVADDEDNNLHLQDAETVVQEVKSSAPVFNITKIYLDAYQQERESVGGRYPQAVDAINNNITDGTLIWNYSGHGGPARLAEEVVVEQQSISKWNNASRLPLLITASCDFAPYDRPGNFSLGEHLLLRPLTGAIALMTTTRTVFAFSNRVMNQHYLQAALKKDSVGNYPTLGQSLLAAKNYTYQHFGDLVNNRKFTLLGDPGLLLGFPKLDVVPLTVNGNPITADTLRAAQEVLLEGAVRDRAGSLVPDFNGTVYLSLYDKPITIMTRGNDPGSVPVAVPMQDILVFKGKASARNGKFAFRFTMPKDILHAPGTGKISLYAADGSRDGNGFSDSIRIGGFSNAPVADRDGPSIKAFLNDDRFVNGSITDPAPVLVVQLQDSSGINIGGSIDHDIIATIDNDNNRFYVLNNFYESDLDNHKKGAIRFQLPELSAGPHTLKIKAWDVLNNSAEYILDFIVVNKEAIVIDRVLNYPNPFTTTTAFCFEHNQPATDLGVQVSIFSVAGKLIKTIRQTINTVGNRSCEVTWDGTDDHHNKVGRGIYIYKLLIYAHGKKASKLEKLVLIN